MCGLNGIFAYGDRAPPVDEAELLRTRERMHARGPDGAGLWTSADRRIGLGHRRLAIIDLSDDGAQPMASAEGRYQIVFNGEIYNHRELRAALERRGASFRSHSDTEVLLHLYAREGSAMCQRLRGMYAFAIWDTHEQALFLARDPFGIKPLYLHDDGQTLRFASQVKALMAGGAIPAEPCAEGEQGYWIWGHVPEPHTLYRHVLAMEAGTWRRIGRGGTRSGGTFESVKSLLSGEAPSPQASLHDALLDSVRHHLVADVPVGVFLSSGIDSSVITAMAAECLRSTGGELRTVTLGFEEYRGSSDDESVLAEQVARQYGARHQTVWISRADFEQAFEQFVDAMDQPSIDGLNTWLVARAAAQLGLKVALSGLGGDELFGGYPSFRQVPQLRALGKPFAALPRTAAAVRRLLGPMLAGISSPKYAGIAEYGGTYEGAYLLRRALRMPWELGLPAKATLAPTEAELLPTPFAAVSYLETTRYMRHQLLRDSDWAGMAHSLEIRLPLVDTELTRHMAAHQRHTQPYRKHDLARTAQPPLPRAVVSRGKTGFTVPVRGWIAANTDAQSAQAGAERGLRPYQQVIGRAFGLRLPQAQSVAVPSPVATRAQARAPKAARTTRLLMLVSDAYGGHGGISVYNRCLAEAMAAMPEVSEVVMVPRVKRFEPSDIPPKVRFLAQAVGSKHRFMRTALQQAGSSPALIFCGHVHLLPVAALLKAITGSPLVLQVHGIEVWQAPGALSRWLVRWADKVWSVSGVTRDRMNAWAQLPADRYTIIPNTVRMDQFGLGHRREDLVARYGLEGRTVIVTLARLAGFERYKGVDETLEVLPALSVRLPNVSYLILGDGDDQPRLEAKAQALGVANRVVFAGFIPEAEKADHLRLGDVFCLPGKGEGFGIVYLEALACGIPVVGSLLDGSSEALRHGMLGELINPDDPASLLEGILRALERPKAVPEGLKYFDWPSYCGYVSEAVTHLRQPSPLGMAS